MKSMLTSGFRWDTSSSLLGESPLQMTACHTLNAEWKDELFSLVLLLPSCSQATGVGEDQLLVTVLPGLPTAAEFFLLPDKLLTEGKAEKTSAHLDQVRQQQLLCVQHVIPSLCRRKDFTSLSSWKLIHNNMFKTSLCLCESPVDPLFQQHLGPCCSLKNNPKFKFLLPPAGVSTDLLKHVPVF